jgi:SET domain-containing protein
MSHPKLEVRDAGGKGRGVFAVVPIARGDLVAPFTGWTLATSQLTDDLFALQIGHDLWLCSHGDQLDDCINHSCDPNTGFTGGAPVLFALRDIAAGEEIGFDYSTSISETGWTLDCACGSPHCRKLIRSWGEMPLEYRERWRRCVLTYLRESA